MTGRPMMIEEQIMVKAYEIDSMGIVSNIVYIKWFEDLRHAFLNKYYPYKEMMKQKISPILVRTEAQYKHPLTITDSPFARSWISRLGKVKWEMMIEIFSGDTLCCTGRQTGCFFDIEKNRPTTTPKVLLDAYTAETSS